MYLHSSMFLWGLIPYSFFIIEYYSIMWMPHDMFIHFLIKGHVGCFQYLVIMNKASLNLYVLVLCEHEFLNQLHK